MSAKFQLPTPLKYSELSDTEGAFVKYDEVTFMGAPTTESNGYGSIIGDTSRYVVAGATVICSQSQAYHVFGPKPNVTIKDSISGKWSTITDNGPIVKLTSFFRGADTGFCIVTLDCDRRESNFIIVKRH